MSVIADILKAKNIEINPHYNGVKVKDGWKHHNWSVTVSGVSHGSFVTEYSKGMGHNADDGVTADDLIPAMIRDAACADDTFEEFCANCGYDKLDEETGKRNKKSYDIYKACGVNAKQLKRFKFTAEQLQAINDYIEDEGL